ncbi:aminoglycoside phosphotransferase family protein [Bacteroides sp. 519]|uniref:aminoglycoside phosphotransferase family protein n=1 Tax=Bacteroides sp. 519 TaxID=2302937 RepID=UPI0013CF851B|nr:aminoglycoside phosphotransferase family protein [Bacteroides sp. 519]NDV56538.1 aminoglycoside phosphotransferase family protein [Bacteroides sp. 519]
MSIENELKIVKRLANVDENRIEVNETGWTSRVYIIDGGRIVFKFPRNVEFQEECKQEIATLKLIKEQHFSLSVPVLNWVAEDNSYFGFYGVEGKPLGIVIDGLNEHQKIEIGTQLGDFLKQLHSIKNYGDIKEQTLEEQAEEYQNWYRRDRDLLKDFFSEPELKKIDDFFTCEMPKCMIETGDLVFCHGDLDYNNTLINDENRVGVIDFGDARLYDRSQDFRGMDDHVLREAMIKAYGGGEIISKEAAEATSKMIDVLNMLYCIEQKDSVGINNFQNRVKSKIL